MNRVVLRLDKPLNGNVPKIRVIEPPDWPSAEDSFDLDPAVPQSVLQKMRADPFAAGTVRDVGSALLELLATHQDFRSHVLPNLRADSTIKESPIYLLIRDTELEQLPWEALHAAAAGFIATDSRWPIARVVKAPAADNPVASFVPPLRLLTVLGASGSDAGTRLSASQEWAELLDAVVGSGLNILLRVLVCEEQLKDGIDALGLEWVSAGFLVDDRGMFDEIDRFKPQLLHFFCHGSADPTPRLQIGSRLDWELKRPGSIIIESGQLRRADPDQAIWLVTLNCCESAQQAATGASHSLPMASALVVAKFPAVVGMREPVEKTLAHTFCGLFYESLFDEMRTRFKAAQDSAEREFHWACGLHAARQAICRKLQPGLAVSDTAPDRKEWTIPVVYTRLEPFRLRLEPDPDGTHPIMRPKTAPAAPAADDASTAAGAADGAPADARTADAARPAAADAAAPPDAAAAPAAAALTAGQIRELADELIALHEERARLKDIPGLGPVLKKIDQRIADINRRLA